MNGKSLNITEEKLNKLKKIVPEAFTENKIDKKTIKTVIDVQPQKIITLDRLFKKNDQLKTNTALQMKDAGIEFKVV